MTAKDLSLFPVRTRLDRVLPAIEMHTWTDEEIRGMIRAIAADADRYAFADRQSAEQATLSLSRS